MGFLKDEEVGKRLEDLRGAKSSRQIAIQAGIDPSQYKKIEKGELSITENILKKIIQEYGWNEDFILFGHGTKVPRGTLDVNDRKEPDKNTENEFLKTRIKDLEEIINLQKKLIENKKEDLPPLKSASAG